MTESDRAVKKANAFIKLPFADRTLVLLMLCVGLLLIAMAPQQISDRDGDGIPDSSESSWGTNPDMADTDLDGLIAVLK